MNIVGRFGAGFLVGIVLAVSIATVTAGDEQPTAVATTTVTTASPVVETEPWFAADEVLLGSTVLLPQSIDVDEGTAYFDYELVGLAPTVVDSDESSDLGAPVGGFSLVPERWELTTSTGARIPGETGPNQSSVRFELPAGDTEISTITITGWRVPVVFGDVVELAVEKGATGELRRGTLTVDAALKQSISTIVQVDLDLTGDSWQSGVFLRPVDPHWQITGGGQAGQQYTWMGDDAPAQIVLEDVGYDFRPVSGVIVVYDESRQP